jgi:polyisoprenoid-binding protein YceI
MIPAAPKPASKYPAANTISEKTRKAKMQMVAITVDLDLKGFT